VSLSGTGIGIPGMGVSPTSLTFGGVTLGSSALLNLTLTSTGTAPLAISSVTLTGPDAASFTADPSSGGSPLDPGANQTLAIRFTPAHTGAHNATLVVASNAPDSPVSVSVSGTGIGIPGLGVNPASLSFGDVILGSSATQNLTLSSTGTAALTISSITITGADAASFSADPSSPGSPLGPGATRTLVIRFTPAHTDAQNATLVIASDAPGSPVSVSLSGTGVGTPALNTSAASLSFGNVTFGGVTQGGSATQNLTLSNTGTAQLTISGITITGPDANSFTADLIGGASPIAPGGIQTIAIHFTPTRLGVQNATLVIASDAPGGPVSVSLSGTGTADLATISGDVRLDTAGNGVLDPNAPPLPGVQVDLLKASTRQIIAGVVTGPSGEFSFHVSAADTYLIAPEDPSGYIGTAAFANSPAAVQNSHEIRVPLELGQTISGLRFLYAALPPPEAVAHVGDPVAATGRLALLGDASSAPNRGVTTIRGATDDGSLYVLDYAGTSLLRLPPAGNTVEVVLDTTRRTLPDGVGLSRILRVEISRGGVIALLILRADNTRGIYRLNQGVLTLLAVLPGSDGAAELAIDGAGRIAYVAPLQGTGAAGQASINVLWQAGNGPSVELLRQGSQLSDHRPIGGFSSLTSNDTGDLAFLVTQADGSPLAVLRRRGTLLEEVALSGHLVAPSAAPGVGATGVLNDMRRPRIGPDGSVVVVGGGDGFTNCYIARPGLPLKPMLVATDWNRDPDSFDYDISTTGAVGCRITPAGSSLASLYLIAPTGDLTLLVGGRRDVQPTGQPLFGPGGPLFFMAQNLDLPSLRSGGAPIGLYRAADGGTTAIAGTALPGQAVPGKPGSSLLTLTQRPVATAGGLAFGIMYGGSQSDSVPSAALVRMPVGGTLAQGELLSPEGQPVTDAGRMATFLGLSYQGDGTLVYSGLMPGGGPVLIPATANQPTTAGVGSGEIHTEAVTAGTPVVPLVATGDSLGSGVLQTLIPPLLSLGTDRELFVARLSASNSSTAPGQEGLFTIRRNKQTAAESVAVTPRPAVPGAVYDGFADTGLVVLSPPSAFADTQSTNVVFKALLARGNSNPTGVFQWPGAGDPSAVALSDVALVPGDPLPYSLERWAAGQGGLAYVLARTAAGKARLFAGSGSSLKPIVEAATTRVTSGGALTDLSDFALAGGGNLFVAGTATSGPGVFMVGQNQVTTIALSGTPAPPLPDGRGSGLVFANTFQLVPGPISGDLIFRATVHRPGDAQLARGEFSYRQGRVETRIIESIGVAGARNVPVQAIADAFPSQSANGVTVSATFSSKEGWVIFRSQLNRDKTGITTDVIAQELHGTQSGTQRFTSLDAGPLLARDGQPSHPGPVFTVNDNGDVAFLASDGKTWAVYQVAGRGA
jgi:hypothetical protein